MSDLINDLTSEPKEFPAFANYKGKCVCVWRADAKLVASTIADAERIMGIRETLKGDALSVAEGFLAYASRRRNRTLELCN